MPYRGFSGGGFVGNFLSTALLEQLRPAADNAGRQATVGDPSTRAAPYRSDGESWKAVVLIDSSGVMEDGAGNNLLAPSSFYKFFIPGQQFIGSGNAKDRSGNSADAVRGASLTDAAAWANPGYITTAAGADRFLSVPVAKSAFNLATQSVIFSARMKKATTAGTEYFFGNAETTTHAGFSLDMRATASSVSKIKLRINNGSSLASLADSTATFGEAAATDHVVGVAIDGVTKAAYLWCDGCLSDTYAAAFTGGALSDLDFAIGSNFGTAGNTAAVGQFSGIHLLAMTGGLPLNIAQVMQRLAGSPHTPLSNLELQF